MIWRAIGPVPLATWRAVLTSVGAPTELSGEACWLAAGEHSALCLAQLLIESRGGTSELARSRHNPLGLRPRDGGEGFVVFPAFVDAIRFWYGKIVDPAYAYADTGILEEYVHVYSPDSDNYPGQEAEYVRDIETYVASWPREEGEPVSVVFSRVKHPPVEIRDIPSSVNHAWDALGKRTIRGIVWHRSLGSHLGNDQYFRGEGASRALTDYGIGVAAQDGPGLAGSLYRWNDPRGDRSPWANGSVNAPYGDGKVFVDRYGIDAVNRDLTSVEVSGFEQTPLDAKSRETLAHLTAYWADQYHVSYETFPLIPSEGNRSFVVWHEEITYGTGKRCPFDVVKAETNDLIARARAILMEAQTGAGEQPKPSPYADPVTGWMAGDVPGKRTDHALTIAVAGEMTDVRVYALERPYEALKASWRYQGPDTRGKRVGPKLDVRERFTGAYWCSVNGKGWVITPNGSFILASSLTPRTSVRMA